MINNRIISKQNINDKVQELNLNEGSQVDGPKIKSQLLMQQVKVIDTKGNLKNVYPSRVDLNFGDSNKLRVVRTYDEQQAHFLGLWINFKLIKNNQNQIKFKFKNKVYLKHLKRLIDFFNLNNIYFEFKLRIKVCSFI